MLRTCCLNKAGLVQATGLKKIELSLRYLLNVQFSEEGPLIRYRALPSLDEEHRKDILKATKANNKILGTYIAEGFDDGTLRKIDVDIAQNVLSGAVEASPEIWRSGWLILRLPAADRNCRRPTSIYLSMDLLDAQITKLKK